MTATCVCGATFTASTLRAASDLLWEHDLRVHRGQQAEVVQLDGVRFRELFLEAIRAIPFGQEFTTADLHDRVPAPPDHHWWGKAQAEARRLRLCRRIGSQTSDLETTKDSLVRRWVRIDEHAAMSA